MIQFLAALACLVVVLAIIGAAVLKCYDSRLSAVECALFDDRNNPPFVR